MDIRFFKKKIIICVWVAFNLFHPFKTVKNWLKTGVVNIITTRVIYGDVAPR